MRQDRHVKPVEEDDSDTIVYLVVEQPGGVDGRDQTDKGGKILFASYSKLQANNNKQGGTVEKRIVNVTEAKAEVLASLTPLQLLMLGLEKDGTPYKPETTYRESSRGD